MPDNGWKENDEGWNLLNGIGCEKDEAEALRLFELSAAKGFALAMVNLGNVYEDREDYEKAYFWYQEAALADNETGMFNVANMYHWGWHVKQDYEKAYRYFVKLYERGYEKGRVCMYLGLYAEKGFLGDADPDAAVRFYEEGISLGDGECATNLGVMYSGGNGVPKDEKRGFELYNKAMELGDILAYANLGYCYETGQGVEKNPDLAREYYELGAEEGEEHCLEKLKELAETEEQPGQELNRDGR